MKYNQVDPPCKYYSECGGCQLQYLDNESQNNYKQDYIISLFKDIKVKNGINQILAMDNPYHYRNKINRTFDINKGKIISGMYKQNTHEVIDIKECLIENPIAEEIIKTIKQIMKKYKMETYDEDKKTGFLRHVLIRTGYYSKEFMVVLVVANTFFTGKKNFVKILTKKHPEIKTIVMNVNNKDTSMILGEKEEIIYGPGFIVDSLCNTKFRISSKSFYQINPTQTEVLYNKAIEMASLKGDEILIDAYSGIGTIGLIASKYVKEVIGVELNKDAVNDSIKNSKINDITNANYYNEDASNFMIDLSEKNRKIDIVIMDPPRSGSDERFLSALIKLQPKKIIYISCNPDTQKRDINYLIENNYSLISLQPVDMFPQTDHVECIALLQRTIM